MNWNSNNIYLVRITFVLPEKYRLECVCVGGGGGGAPPTLILQKCVISYDAELESVII